MFLLGCLVGFIFGGSVGVILMAVMIGGKADEENM